jgi:predicted fused transcriptional regulator/phosphomethylpyrimidine kinase
MVKKAVRNVKFDFEDVVRDLDSTKLKIPNFQRKKDLEVYLEWGEKVDWIFLLP